MKIGRTNHLLVEVLANIKLLICFHKKNLFTWLCLPTVPEDWSQGRLQNLPSPSTKPSAPQALGRLIPEPLPLDPLWAFPLGLGSERESPDPQRLREVPSFVLFL